MEKWIGLSPKETKTGIPPFNGFPIKGRNFIDSSEVDYFKNKLRQRKDIKSNMVDRLIFTLDLFTTTFENRTRMDVLDVGCNTGIFTRTLAQAGNYVLGLDIDPKKIEIAKQETKKLGTNVRYEVANAVTDIEQFANTNSFDAALCTEVLEHVPQYQKVVSQIMRTIKPGGILLLTVPKEGKVHDPGHINIFTTEKLLHELAPYGEVTFHTPPEKLDHLNRWFFVTIRK